MAQVMLQMTAAAAGWMPSDRALRQVCAQALVMRMTAMRPGTAVFAGDPLVIAAGDERLPAAFEALRQAFATSGLKCCVAAAPAWLQVYRLMDEHGRFARDVIAPAAADPIAGMVLLETVVDQGRWLRDSFDGETVKRWMERQRGAVPVEADRYTVRSRDSSG